MVICLMGNESESNTVEIGRLLEASGFKVISIVYADFPDNPNMPKHKYGVKLQGPFMKTSRLIKTLIFDLGRRPVFENNGSIITIY